MNPLSLLGMSSDLSDKIKREFFQAVTVSVLLYEFSTRIQSKLM